MKWKGTAPGSSQGWFYKASQKKETHTLQPLPDPSRLLATSSKRFETLCAPLTHTGSTFFKTIHLTWTASQRISFVLESFPEQQPHYEGVFKQMPPASASVSDNKTFSAWNIMAWLWWFIRGAWHLLLSSLHSIILQTVNRWGWLPPPWKALTLEVEEDSDTSEFEDLTHLPALWPA